MINYLDNRCKFKTVMLHKHTINNCLLWVTYGKGKYHRISLRSTGQMCFGMRCLV